MLRTHVGTILGSQSGPSNEKQTETISFIDEGMKALEASTMEVGENEQNNHILKNQLQDFSHLQEQLNDC